MNPRKAIAIIDTGKIIRYRNERKISQADFAAQCNLSQAVIHYTETTGKSDPRISTVKKIADVMGCLVDDLLLK